MFAMKKPEKVIRELQGALSKDSTCRKSAWKLNENVKKLQQSNDALRSENSKLKQLEGVQEIEELKLELEAAREDGRQGRKAYHDLESEKLDAMMRMEKAEASSIAAQNELLEVSLTSSLISFILVR